MKKIIALLLGFAAIAAWSATPSFQLLPTTNTSAYSVSQVPTWDGDKFVPGSGGGAPTGPSKFTMGLLMWDGSTARWQYTNTFGPLVDEFMTTFSSGQFGWVFTANSGSQSWASELGHPGVVTLSTGSSTSSSPDYSTAAGTETFSINSGSSEVYYLECLVKTPSAASDGTDTYNLRIGFNDASMVDCAGMFYYNHATNSGKWTFVTASNTANTVTDTGVSFATSTWVNFGCLIDSSVPRCIGYINGTPVATNTTTIPTGTTRAFYPRMVIVKTAGTTSRTLGIDRTVIAGYGLSR